MSDKINSRMKRFVQNINIVYIYIIHVYVMANDVARDQYGNPRGRSISITIVVFSLYQYLFPKSLIDFVCMYELNWTSHNDCIHCVKNSRLQVWRSRREKKIRVKICLKNDRDWITYRVKYNLSQYFCIPWLLHLKGFKNLSSPSTNRKIFTCYVL